jgi:predicted AAA+ superfamily ATPase
MLNFSEEQIIEKIRFENPWWRTNVIDDYYNDMSRRPYFDLFSPLVFETTIRRAVVLMGPRRVGKSVMLFHTIQKLINAGVKPTKIAYVSVETPIYSNISLEHLFKLCCKAAGEDEKGFFMFFDEIQYLPDWELHLKSLVDAYLYSKFVVSGSAAAALKLKSNESGAGRFTDFFLPAVNFYEFLKLKNINEAVLKDKNALNEYFVDYVNFGGYPEVIFSAALQAKADRYLRNDIVDKVLLHDLPSLYGIRDVQELNRLFNVLAYNSGNEISLDTLNKTSGIDKQTMKKYFEYLESAFLIKIIHRIDVNSKRFKRENFFKAYLTNPSLRSALFAPLSFVSDDKMIGNMIETTVFSQFHHKEIHYARWNDGEVDFILSDNNFQPAFTLEIKWTNRYFQMPGTLKSLLYYAGKNNLKKVFVTTINKEGNCKVNDVEIVFLPVAVLCFLMGTMTLNTPPELLAEKLNDLQQFDKQQLVIGF